MGWASNDDVAKASCEVAAVLAKQQIYIVRQRYAELVEKVKLINHTEKRTAMLDCLPSDAVSMLDALYQAIEQVQFHLGR